MPVKSAAGNRLIGNPSLFETEDLEAWDEAYREVMIKKYAKNTRNFSRQIKGKQWSGEGPPPVYLVPRVRTESYLRYQFEGVADSSDIQYAPISKGFSMQDVSSFTLGPVVGEGLCLVNAAFSKIVTVSHIRGGGRFSLKRKYLWQDAARPDRDIVLVGSGEMLVDGERVDIKEWLRDNESLWFDEWDLWRRHVALCGEGDFHWSAGYPVIAYRRGDQYLTFGEWKRVCYIKPSLELLPKTDVFQFLQQVRSEGVPVGLVHPMVSNLLGEALRPVTMEELSEMIDSDESMVCQPYVVAAALLGMKAEDVSPTANSKYFNTK
jgi:hypothetical protein